MAPVRFPGVMAIAGIAVGFLWAFWSIFAPQGSLDGFLGHLMFVTCPTLVIFMFSMGVEGTALWVFWGIVIVLNGTVYYYTGLLLLGAVRRIFRRKGTE